MADYEKSRDFILDKLDERTLLEALAEEAAELSQAALKLIRARGLSKNTTPKTEAEATYNLVEEMTDCSMVMTLLCLKNKSIPKTEVEHGKWKRWAERLGYEPEYSHNKVEGVAKLLGLEIEEVFHITPHDDTSPKTKKYLYKKYFQFTWDGLQWSDDGIKWEFSDDYILSNLVSGRYKIIDVQEDQQAEVE